LHAKRGVVVTALGWVERVLHHAGCLGRVPAGAEVLPRRVVRSRDWRADVASREDVTETVAPETLLAIEIASEPVLALGGLAKRRAKLVTGPGYL
jgi:hypothetical protein